MCPITSPFRYLNDGVVHSNEKILLQECISTTQKSYKVGTRKYVQFCWRSSLPCVPTSEKTLLLFATYLAIRGLSYGTIKVCLAAVWYLHTTAGHHNTYNSHFTPRTQKAFRRYLLGFDHLKSTSLSLSRLRNGSSTSLASKQQHTNPSCDGQQPYLAFST